MYRLIKKINRFLARIAIAYITVMVFLFSDIYSGQLAVACVFSGFVIILLGYCYQYDLSVKPENTITRKPLFLTSLFILTLILIASFFIFGPFVLIQHQENSPRDLLFYSFITLPVCLFLIWSVLFSKKGVTIQELKERYEKKIEFDVPYGYAFDLCRRSVQRVSDLAVLDADRKSGIIHTGKLDIFQLPQASITFTVEKVTIGKTRITITDTEPGYDHWNSQSQEIHRYQVERKITALAEFITELAVDPGSQTPPDTKTRQDPIRAAGKETEEKIRTPGRDLKRYAPYLFILAGIVLTVWGVFIDISVIEAILKGSLVLPSHHYDGRPISLSDYLVSPVIPGVFALIAGGYMLLKPRPATVTDTDPKSPTGILVGKEPFYRDPFEAAISSVFVPGLGQAYNGRADMGLLLAFGAGGGLLFALVPGILVWVYAVWEAYSTAQQINREEVPAYPYQEGMAVFIVMIFGLCVLLTMFLYSQYGPAVALGLDFSTIRGPS